MQYMYIMHVMYASHHIFLICLFICLFEGLKGLDCGCLGLDMVGLGMLLRDLFHMMRRQSSAKCTCFVIGLVLMVQQVALKSNGWISPALFPLPLVRILSRATSTKEAETPRC